MTRLRLSHLLCLALLLPMRNAGAQARSTATQTLRLSVFAGPSAAFDALGGGHTTAITAGADLGFRTLYRLHPALEVRGSYPVSSGQVDQQKTLLAGLKLEHRFGRLRPYGDLLFGRGELDYGHGFVNASRTVYYVQTVSNVFSSGAGLDVDLTPQLAFKIDAQWQRFATPVTASGQLNVKTATAGAVFRFNFNRHRRIFGW